jgi:hypothetical protein
MVTYNLSLLRQLVPISIYTISFVLPVIHKSYYWLLWIEHRNMGVCQRDISRQAFMLCGGFEECLGGERGQSHSRCVGYKSYPRMF